MFSVITKAGTRRFRSLIFAKRFADRCSWARVFKKNSLIYMVEK